MSSGPHEMLPPLQPAHHNSGSRRGSMQPLPSLSPSANAEVNANLPLRHPRPLTAVELHLELEKEQEARVNRLTRELTALRAHSASVASTTSTTSNAAPFILDPLDPSSLSQPLPLANGPTHPTVTRSGRSGSNASTSNHPHPDSGAPPTSNPHRTTRSSSISIQGTSRYDDVAQHRLEFEEVKAENERLRQRVMELEGLLRGRRTSAV